jgi:hypothetical protein
MQEGGRKDRPYDVLLASTTAWRWTGRRGFLPVAAAGAGHATSNESS